MIEADGFVVLHDVFPDAALKTVEESFVAAARRIATAPEPLDLLRAVERQDKAAFFALCEQQSAALVPYLQRAMPELQAMSPTPCTLFYNERQVTRLHYDWHQESAYYPGKGTSYHAWFPLFRDISVADGPMIVCRGSHKTALPFSAERAAQSVTQMRIADVSAFEQVACAIPRGSAVIFHGQLVHKTGENLTDVPRTSGVVRFFP